MENSGTVPLNIAATAEGMDWTPHVISTNGIATLSSDSVPAAERVPIARQAAASSAAAPAGTRSR